MRLESLASRLEFNERRARALESVVAYKSFGETEETAPVSAAAATFPAAVAAVSSHLSWRARGSESARECAGRARAAIVPRSGRPFRSRMRAPIAKANSVPETLSV